MKSIVNKAIVIGSTHHNTLSIVRCLGSKCVSISLILVEQHKANNYVACSKYVTDCAYVSSAEAAAEYLKSCYIVESSKLVIVVCSDEVSSFLDNHYEEYKQHFHFFNAGVNGRVTHFMDKRIQTELAEVCGLDVPISLECTITESLSQFDFFPCIIKPLESIHGGKKFKICLSKQDLNHSIKDYSLGDRVLIQQFVEREYEIVVDGVSVDGKVLIPGYIEKHRDLLGGTTYSSTHKINKLPTSVIEAIKKMIHEINYEGLFGVELIVCNDKYYFVEINLRNDATTYSLCCAGVNLPYIYFLAKQGLPYGNELANPMIEIKSMVEFRDFDHVLKRRISYKEWISQREKCKCLYFFDKNDILPYKRARKHYILEKITNILKRFG